MQVLSPCCPYLLVPQLGPKDFCQELCTCNPEITSGTKSYRALDTQTMLSPHGSRNTNQRPDGVNVGGWFCLEDWFYSQSRGRQARLNCQKGSCRRAHVYIHIRIHTCVLDGRSAVRRGKGFAPRPSHPEQAKETERGRGRETETSGIPHHSLGEIHKRLRAFVQLLEDFSI